MGNSRMTPESVKQNNEQMYVDLVDCLEDLVKVYRALLDVVRREKEILVAAKLDELNENNKEFEINRAMSGEHFYDGFIKNYKKDEAKEIIDGLLRRLNNGEKLTAEDVEKALGSHVP